MPRAPIRALLPLAFLIFLFQPSLISAQEQPKDYAVAEKGESPAPGKVFLWKVLNTGIFAIAMAAIIAKTAPGFFSARSADIQRAIKEATGLKIAADFRYSESDRKLATLADQVKRLRLEAAEIMERDHRRILQETDQELEHIHANVAAEIEAFRAEGRQKIRRHTAQLALASAERRLRDRLSSGQFDNLVGDFVHLVEGGNN